MSKAIKMLIGATVGLALLLGPTAVYAGDKAKKHVTKETKTDKSIDVGGLLDDLSLVDGGTGSLIDGGKKGVLNGLLDGALNDLLTSLLGGGLDGLPLLNS